MHTVTSMFHRSAALRFVARVLVFVIIAVPLLRLALKLESSIGHLPAIETILLVAGFCYLEAVALVLAAAMFKKVP